MSALAFWKGLSSAMEKTIDTEDLSSRQALNCSATSGRLGVSVGIFLMVC